MSQQKLFHEAQRWLKTAHEDLGAARVLSTGKRFSHACFFAQQSGEKALKALWFLLGEDPWGHSVQKLIEELPDPAAKTEFATLIEDASLRERVERIVLRIFGEAK